MSETTEKDKKRVAFWRAIETGTNCPAEPYLKNLLKYAGYDNRPVMSLYEEPECYNDLIKSGRSKVYLELAKKSNLPMTDFFPSAFVQSPEEFELVPGDKIFLRVMKNFCKDPSKDSYFQTSTRANRKSAKGSEKVHVPAKTPSPRTSQDESKKITNYIFDAEEEKSKIKNVLLQIDEKFEKDRKNVDAKKFIKKRVQEQEDCLNVTVTFVDNDVNQEKIQAVVSCVAAGCKNRSKFEKAIDKNWIFSNYYRHITTQHVNEKPGEKRKRRSTDAPNKRSRIENQNNADGSINDDENNTEDTTSTVNGMDMEPVIDVDLTFDEQERSFEGGSDGIHHQGNSEKQEDPLGLDGAEVTVVIEADENPEIHENV